MKQCRICLHFKPVTSFHKNGFKRKNGSSGIRTECKSCSKNVHDKYVETHREELNKYMKGRYDDAEKRRIRSYGLERMYGLSENDYNNILALQNNKCAICNIDQSNHKRPFDVDHCHETGSIRGLLCMRCNRAMGLFKDNIDILLKAASYLKKNKK